MSLVTACVLALALAGCGEKSDQEILQSAKKSFAERDFAAAKIELKSLLGRKPDDGAARLLFGRLLLEEGDSRSALVELNKAKQANVGEVELAPWLARAMLENGKYLDVIQAYADTKLESPAAQAELGVVVAGAMFRAGRIEDGNAALSDVLAKEPQHSGALLLQAKFAAATGRFDEALSLAQRAISADAANGEAHKLRASVLYTVKGDLEGALTALDLAAADRRHAVVARMTTVGILADMGRTDEARRVLEVLARSHPNQAGTLYADAYLSLRLGKLDAAKDKANRLLRQFGESSPFLQLSGAIDLRRKELASAAAKLKKAVSLDGSSARARKLLADVYLAMGDGERALVSLQPLIEARSRDADALMRVGQARLLMGDSTSAEAAFQAAARLRPGDTEIATVLSLRALQAGDAERGFSELNAIAARDAGTSADLALISSHFRRGEHERALIAIERLRGKLPSSPLPEHLRAEALKLSGDLAAARKAYEAALKLDPSYFTSTAALVMLDIDGRDLKAARDRLDAALKARPGEARAHLLRLRVMSLQRVAKSELEKAIAEAVRSSPTDPAVRLAQIDWLKSANNFQGALSAAQSAQAALPDSPALLDALGLAYLQTRDMRQAASAFEKLAGLMPRSALPHLRLAELHERQGDFGALKTALARAYEQEPLSTDLRRRLMKLASANKSGADFVVDLARESQKRSAASPVGFVLEGDVELLRKRYDMALPLFRQALNRAQSDHVIAGRIYDTLATQGKRTEANAFAEARLRERPADAAFLGHLGQSAMLRNDMQAAERWWRQLIGLQPDNGSAHNNLAMVLAAKGSPEAVQSAQRALELMPGQAAVLDTYARALAAQKRLPEAIDAQKKAVAAAGGNPAFRLVLADLYLQARDLKGASAELEALEALGSAFAQQGSVARLRQRLQQQ